MYSGIFQYMALLSVPISYLYEKQKLTMIYCIFILTLGFIGFVYADIADAADWYINSDAAGAYTGHNWDDAWTSLPQTLIRGDTYWVSDGSYSEYTFSDAGADTLYIQVRKATIAQHGTDVGWNDSFGDGQAVFGPLTINASYVIFSGAERSGLTNGHGFKIQTGQDKGIRISAVDIRNVTLEYIEVEGVGNDGLGTPTSNDLVYLVTASTDIIFRYCYLHDAGRTIFLGRYADRVTIDHNLLARNESITAEHSEGISASYGTDEWVVSNNIWSDVEGTGVIVFEDSDGWQVYNNLIYWTGNPEYRGISNASIGTWTNGVVTNTNVYNNTVYNGSGYDVGIDFNASNDGRGNTAYNNLIYLIAEGTATILAGSTHDFNASPINLNEDNNFVITTDPFVDAMNNDFTLREDSPLLGAGVTMPWMAPTDMNGSPFGDLRNIGAFAAQGDIQPPPPPPVDPPVIGSVTLVPNSGFAKVGDLVTVLVTEANGTPGYTPSTATINGNQVLLIDQGDGTYLGAYRVQQGDVSSEIVEATGITLSGPAGTTPSASSTGSTLIVDALPPQLESVTIDPHSGEINPGQMVTITAAAVNSESGLVVSDALFAGQHVPLADIGNGRYRGTYIIQASDQGSEFAPGALFTDDFESGDTGNWDIVEPGIVVGDVGKFGIHSVQYTIQSADRRRLLADIGVDQAETYTSFYFRLSPDFYMVDNDVMYISLISDGIQNLAWAARIKRLDGTFRLEVFLEGYVTQIGNDYPINTDEWYWVKIHHLSAIDGLAEWWLNGALVGQYSGDTSIAYSRDLAGMYLNQMDAATTGTIYFDDFQVTTTDHSEPMVLEATGITLTDEAGNASAPASSYGSTLKVVVEDINSWGDVDDNGSIDILDGLVIASYDIDPDLPALMLIASMIQERGDVDASQNIDITDALMCATYELFPELPYPGDRIGTRIPPAPKTVSGSAAITPALTVNTEDATHVLLHPSVAAYDPELRIGAVAADIRWNPDKYEFIGPSEVQDNTVANDDSIAWGLYRLSRFSVEGEHDFKLPGLRLAVKREGMTDDFNFTVNNAVEAMTFRQLDPGSPVVTSFEEARPARYFLYPASPNPFNATTTIRYELAERANVRLDIFNIAGQRVRTLVDTAMDAGRHAVLWDGDDDAGNPVGSGTYLSRLTTSRTILRQKMMLLK